MAQMTSQARHDRQAQKTDIRSPLVTGRSAPRLASDTANAKLDALLAQYQRTGSPLDVSFREILRAPSTVDRATHDIHPYPAKLLVNIPSFFLATNLSRPSDVVLDPFCGSGTVLLEALLAKRTATGADANPLARLITRAKVTPIASDTLRRTRRLFFSRLPSNLRRTYPDVLNLQYWFYPHVRRDLLRLLDNIERIQDATIRDFFLVSLSASIKDVSLSDPRLSVPVRLRENQYAEGHVLRDCTNRRLRQLRSIDVIKMFTKRLDDNIRRMECLATWPRLGQQLGLASDARAMTHLASASVDLVITSPPYLGAQKYIRASSLSLTWLGLCHAHQLRALQDQNIGREHYRKSTYAKPKDTGLPEAETLLRRVRKLNPLRAHIAACYLCEMRDAFQEINRVLKPRSNVILIAGASSVCGIQFPTPLFLIRIAAEVGLRLRLHVVDKIHSRSLMTKRHHTAGRIDEESILVFSKDR